MTMKKSVCFVACVLLTLSAMAQLGPTNPAPSVTLAWDVSPDPTVVGYYVYQGYALNMFTNMINAGGTNAVTIGSGLLKRGSTYYFAATCYTATGLESAFSTNLIWTVPVPPPQVTSIKVLKGN